MKGVPLRAMAFVTAFALFGVVARALQETPGRAQETNPAGSFEEFLAGVRAEALDRGIGAATIERALTGIEPLPVVIERDRTQAESTLSLDRYLQRRLTPQMVRTGRERARQHGAILRVISKKYEVPSEVIVATWGLESNFGRFTGTRPTITALATLAYDERRSALFRQELFSALRIVDRGDIDLDSLRGSWAGAMGQPQFMPSSYLEYAQDFDGDGHPDIWKSTPDVFASIANYLKGKGWTTGQRWGRRVRVSDRAAKRIEETIDLRSGCRAMREMRGPRRMSEWRTLGVRLSSGGPLPASDMTASLVQLGEAAYLTYPNYDALLAYNCAHPYALSLAILSERIAAGR